MSAPLEDGSSLKKDVATTQDEMELRPGVSIKKDTFSYPRIAGIFSEEKFEGRSTYIEVQDKIGGQILYKDKDGITHPVELCWQRTEKNGVDTYFLSVENEWEGFMHLPINLENKTVALELLARNLKSMAELMQTQGIDISPQQFVQDILSSIGVIGNDKLLSTLTQS